MTDVTDTDVATDTTAVTPKTTTDATAQDADKLAREVARNKKALDAERASVEALKAQLQRFEGIDPDAIKVLLTEKAEAQAAAAKLEEERLKASGDFESLKKRMSTEHQRELEAERARTAEAAKAQAALHAQIHELTIGAAFASSTFIQENTLLPVRQARRSFEEYFEVKDGEIVSYDRPANEKGRIPLVDSRGRNLKFDEAIKQIIEADPDRDRLLKATQKQGSGTAPSKGKVQSADITPQLTGVAAIAAALAARKNK